MKERPILFSAPMVRAILDGRKTQTRRVMKFRGPYAKRPPTLDEAKLDHGSSFMHERGFFDVRCPYGQPGDRLWVRETWAPCEAPARIGSYQYAADGAVGRTIDFAGELGWRRNGHTLGFTKNDEQGVWVGPPSRWRPSIHMPRQVSRITLEVESVRVERLQEISEEDAKAEGVVAEPHNPEGDCWTDGLHRTAFERLWGEINGFPGEGERGVTWDANPWVWVVSFKRVAP